MASSAAKRAFEEDNVDDEIPRLKLRRTGDEKRLIVILENASLEVAKIGKQYELLSSDKHRHLAKKFKRDMATCRPDILHQCCLMLQDSPLNKFGLLQIYIHTEGNVLIEVNPSTRFPRTYDRFAGLMIHLMHKLSVRSTDGTRLLKVIKNPITDHLPVGCAKYCTSYSADTRLTPKELRDMVPADQPIVMVVGAMAHGKVNVDYTERDLSLSTQPMSAALTCAKLCCAFEEAWECF